MKSSLLIFATIGIAAACGGTTDGVEAAGGSAGKGKGGAGVGGDADAGGGDAGGPSAWTVETIDARGHRVSDVATAIDRAEQLHVTYLDETDGKVMYASRTIRDGWRAETVHAAGGLTGRRTAICVDSSGLVHIAFWNGSSGAGYAEGQAGTWSVEEVTPNAFTGTTEPYVSLAEDRGRRPSLSCARRREPAAASSEFAALDLEGESHPPDRPPYSRRALVDRAALRKPDTRQCRVSMAWNYNAINNALNRNHGVEAVR